MGLASSKRRDARRAIVDDHPHASLPPLLPNRLLDPLAARVDLHDAEAGALPRRTDALAIPRLRLVVLEQERCDGGRQVDERAFECEDRVGKGRVQ